jgi:hypothetical protein
MQGIFQNNAELKESFKLSLSNPRFATYLKLCRGDENEAILLYQWNARASQSLYIFLQTWEICFRNKLHNFLGWKYNQDWPNDPRLQRNLTSECKRRLLDAIERQRANRGIAKPSAPMVVADLSAGFWVALLSGAYDVPFTWRYNITRIFPHATTPNRMTMYNACNNILDLRNRIAHHEPIFKLDLQKLYDEMRECVGFMCKGSLTFASESCSFASILANRPPKS